MAPDYLRELCWSVSEDDARSSLRSASREQRQSSATEHSPSRVLWCGTVCQRQSEIPAPCQTSNLLWSLTCLLDYSWGCTNSFDLWRCPWIGFTCYGTIEIIVVVLLLLLLNATVAMVLPSCLLTCQFLLQCCVVCYSMCTQQESFIVWVSTDMARNLSQTSNSLLTLCTGGHFAFSSSSFIAYSAGALLCPQCAASRHE